MALFGSLSVVILLVSIQTTLGRWPWLEERQHPVLIDLAAGAALAYVFVHLLPKLASTQEKFTGVTVSEASGFVHNHVYLLALIGLVLVYWLEAASDRAVENATSGHAEVPYRAVLAGGYGLYFLMLGYLIADMPRPDALSYLLVGIVLGLHMVGIVHRLRRMAPTWYDRALRWIFASLVLLGWLAGRLTALPATMVMLVSALVSGGIIIIALREELPGHGSLRIVPFLGSVVLTSLGILWIHALQGAT
ncbi:MAG: hypothetical protein PVH91_09480 [Pseudomonadales bacterium]|jgi:hypothetical protein